MITRRGDHATGAEGGAYGTHPFGADCDYPYVPRYTGTPWQGGRTGRKAAFMTSQLNTCMLGEPECERN